MLRATLPPHNAAVKEIVDRLLAEDAKFSQDRRSSHRVALVRPVEIRLTGDDGGVLVGCTRNVSPDGVGILLNQLVENGLTAKLLIHSLRDDVRPILAEARWCVEFGRGWYLSGWKFISAASG